MDALNVLRIEINILSRNVHLVGLVCNMNARFYEVIIAVEVKVPFL